MTKLLKLLEYSGCVGTHLEERGFNSILPDRDEWLEKNPIWPPSEMGFACYTDGSRKKGQSGARAYCAQWAQKPKKGHRGAIS